MENESRYCVRPASPPRGLVAPETLYTAGAVPPDKRPGEIEQRLDSLSSVLSALEDTAHEVERRLVSILRPEPVNVEFSKTTEPSTPMGLFLATMEARAKTIGEILHSINQRCEL